MVLSEGINRTQTISLAAFTANMEPQVVMINNKNTTSKQLTMTKNIAEILRNALQNAKSTNRLIIGLSETAKNLSKTPDDALICFLAPPNAGDSATHMHEVLLEAYCYENDIYVIKVDDAENLSRIVDSPTIESCAIIQKHSQLTSAETQLVDYCEEYWDAPKQPIIQLPGS